MTTSIEFMVVHIDHGLETNTLLTIYYLNACALVTDIESNPISSTELVAEDKGVW
jgi:hypothetical protein